MKVYVLKTSRGSWDDYFQYKIGIFSTLEKAEEAKQNWINEIEKILKENPNPFDEKKMELFNMCELSEEEEQPYLDWYYGQKMGKIKEAKENDVWVEEINVDEILANVFGKED